MPQIDFSRVISAGQELGALRDRLCALLLARIEARMQEIAGPVPLAEKLAWPLKEEAARAWLQGDGTGRPDPILLQEAALMGEPVTVLAQNILIRAEAWRQAVSEMTALRRRALGALALAATPAEAEAVLAEAEAALQRL